uniref:Uncharacterized protein n=1 Tax=Arundo donax TaxID=35708 RepID=A0A0A9GXB5_ARUDO
MMREPEHSAMSRDAPGVVDEVKGARGQQPPPRWHVVMRCSPDSYGEERHPARGPSYAHWFQKPRRTTAPSTKSRTMWTSSSTGPETGAEPVPTSQYQRHATRPLGSRARITTAFERRLSWRWG